jgi:hypothetical protein
MTRVDRCLIHTRAYCFAVTVAANPLMAGCSGFLDQASFTTVQQSALRLLHNEPEPYFFPVQP